MTQHGSAFNTRQRHKFSVDVHEIVMEYEGEKISCVSDSQIDSGSRNQVRTKFFTRATAYRTAAAVHAQLSLLHYRIAALFTCPKCEIAMEFLGLSATTHFLSSIDCRSKISIPIPPSALSGRPLWSDPIDFDLGRAGLWIGHDVLAGLPSLRLFGGLSAVATVAALFADLFMLRPIAMFLSTIVRRTSQQSLVR